MLNNKPLYKKVCIVCKAEFYSKREDKKVCSFPCKRMWQAKRTYINQYEKTKEQKIFRD